MPAQDLTSRQSILADQFFYFFLRLRKKRIRAVVEAVNSSYPEESAEQKARRLIEAQTPLSFLGGTLIHLPMLVPGLGQAFQFLGFVGGTSAITRMHLYLILEIALLYGTDIEDEARVPEMLAVVAATGLAAGAPLLANVFDINPLFCLPVGGITASAAARMIGEEAIRYYSKPADEFIPAPPA
ncbi:MAG: hypothetical protein ABSE08_03370 [Syntrophobacteraceae bacterium]|jgi:hypothetical protein